MSSGRDASGSGPDIHTLGQEFHFQRDEEALRSILENRGITTVKVRAYTRPSQAA
jgi:hypothetical protein